MSRDPARLVLPFAAIGGAGALLAAAAGVADPDAAARGWLVATLIVLGLSLGAMALRAIHALTDGRWGDALEAPLRAMAALMPLAMLAFLPILFLVDRIFPWRDDAPGDPLILAKLGYMATPFLIARLAGCFAVFLAAALLSGTWSGARPGAARAIGALILWSLGLLIFSTDWMIAPDPRFYSTIYPVLEAGAEMLAAFAVATLVATRFLPFANPVTGAEYGTRLSEDLANLLFGFLLLFVYLAFMQWLIVWSGDLPEEIGWYLDRGTGIWRIALIAAALLATLSVAGLLMRGQKSTPAGLARLACLVLAAILIDDVWRLRASFPGPSVTLADAAALIGLGLLWCAGVLALLMRGSRGAEASAHG